MQVIVTTLMTWSLITYSPPSFLKKKFLAKGWLSYFSLPNQNRSEHFLKHCKMVLKKSDNILLFNIAMTVRKRIWAALLHKLFFYYIFGGIVAMFFPEGKHVTSCWIVTCVFQFIVIYSKQAFKQKYSDLCTECIPC